jgi:predicted nucleic-acid-binding protein
VIGVDTNVIVRLLVGDDVKQADAATRYLKAHSSSDEPALLSDIVLVETAWVLEDLYGYSRAQIAEAMEGLLATAQLKVGNAGVNVALERYRSSTADFADCLIGVNNVAAGCEYTATFDRKASRLTEFKLIAASASRVGLISR